MYFWLETPATMLLLILGIGITLSAQLFVNSTYKKYIKVGNKKGITGFEAARKILDANGLENIHIVEVKNLLGDHYDPRRKVVRLSTEVFHGDSITSVSIASHEAAHAVQHKMGYLFMKIRGFIAPYVAIGSRIGYIAIFIGMFFGINDLIPLGIVLLFGIVVFELITLPVEYDASKRAKEEMGRTHILDSSEIEKASNMLNAAALTYVAAIAASLLQIVRLMLMYRRRN